MNYSKFGKKIIFFPKTLDKAFLFAYNATPFKA